MLNQASQYHQSGQYQDAEKLYQQVLQMDPENPDANHLLGVLAYQAGQYTSAAQLISKAILNDGNQAPYFNNLGLALQAQGDYAKAEMLFRQAVALDVNYAEAYSNLGISLEHLGRLEEALVAYQNAISVSAEFANAYNSRGVVLHKLGRYEEAQASLQQAIRIEPDFAEAFNNLGNSLEAQGRIEEALEAYRGVLRIDLGHARACSNQLLCMNYDSGTDADTLFTAHREWHELYAESLLNENAVHNNNPDPERRLRIGYVSADFFQHPVASFIEPVIAGHDRKIVEVFCYSSVVTEDDVTQRIKSKADHWYSIKGWSDDDVTAHIWKDDIDILVDLSGHTAGNRLLVFARRPAPIQATYLGYPGTSGLSVMDYRISDPWNDPQGLTEEFHTEEIVRLPEGSLCYQPPAQDIPVVPVDVAPGNVTFASFNNNAKVSPAAIALWSKVLLAVPGAKLLLKSRPLADRGTADRLRQAFSAQGIAGDRLEFIGWTATLQEHLALYNRVHIGLDTLPYSGCTTTCEALWMGVPVITLANNESRSRMSSGVLAQSGLADLIAESEESFIEKAKSLAEDIPRLNEYRKSLRQMLKDSSLINPVVITGALEDAYREMWKKWCATRLH